jgi:hypothetical protein
MRPGLQNIQFDITFHTGWDDAEQQAKSVDLADADLPFGGQRLGQRRFHDPLEPAEITQVRG